MGESRNGSSDEGLIRDLVESWARAVRNKDLAGVLRYHSPDMLMFDVPPPFQLKGIKDYETSWGLFFSWAHDPVVFDINEMNITACSDVAFVTAAMQCSGREASGEDIELDFRLTIGLRKIDDQWIIVHEHHSIPAT